MGGRLEHCLGERGRERVIAPGSGAALDEGVAPALEVAAPLGLDAQHLGDDREGDLPSFLTRWLCAR
jgi:hypothetical protein